MKASDFDYELPQELIAYYPQTTRQNSRLLLLNKKSGEINHSHFYELPELLNTGDVLVLNNTKVIPARLYGRRKAGAEVEVLLVLRISENTWECLVRNPKDNEVILFEGGITGRLLRGDEQKWMIEFEEPVDNYIDTHGYMPLPPYIVRRPEDSDKTTYQTVYAEHSGAIAAPTAGLHFTTELLEEIMARGIEIENVTLHVGIGTFKPVKTESIDDHIMHAEYREVGSSTAEAINKAKSEGRRVVAVGTTVVRTLESSVSNGGKVVAQTGQTDLFITPGFKFNVVDALVTNFHLPRSTLLMLVSAFSERQYIFNAYEEAKDNNYRFLSYGDAMFIY